MSVDNFISTIWAARLLENLNKEHVYIDLFNRDFEGEIKKLGNTVKITGIGRVAVGNYTKNTDITDPETLTDAQSTLVIDIAKFFNFQVDDVDKAQGNPGVIDEAMKEAAYSLSEAIDILAAAQYANASASNKIGADGSTAKLGGVITLGRSAIYDYLVDLGTALTKKSVPTSGRWCVIPPWAHGMLQKDDRFSGKDEVLQNGVIGRVAGFDLRVSNNVTTDGQTVPTYRIMAGYKGTCSYAEAINSVEAYRPQKRFADAMKGLLLAGMKTVRPDAMAVLFAKETAE